MGEQHFRLSELDNDIIQFQNIISLSLKSHPQHVFIVICLADARFERYKLSQQQDDLNRSILGNMEAIFLPYPWHDHSLLFLKTFRNLATALLTRAKKLKQPEDVKSCIIFFRYLHDQHHRVIPDRTTANLVNAFAVKAELELGDVREDIEEIANLCHKHLNSHISMSSQQSYLGALERVVDALFRRGRIWEEEKVIQCLREANMRLPDLHKAPILLADALLRHFEGTGSIDDYEEGTAILDKVIAFRAGDAPSSYREKALGLGLAASFAIARFYKFGKPDHLEEAIYRLHNFLDVISPDDPDRPYASLVLSSFQKMRGLDQVDIGGSNFESRGQPSFRDLTTSLAQSNMDTISTSEPLSALTRTSSLTDISEIEDAIKYFRQLLDSPLSGQSKVIASDGLGVALIRAFECTNKIMYLNEAISQFQDGLNRRPDAHIIRAYGLIQYLTIRFRLLHHEEDLNELMQQFPIAVNDIRAAIPRRFELSCQWARLARTSRHPSIPTAYDHAISLMQATLTFSPTLHSQHLRLVAMRDSYERLPLDYASYLVRRAQLKKAIETLERGRALIWSEMRGFRTSIDKIRTASSDLADRFAAVNRELEMLTLTSSNHTGDDGIKRMGPYGDLVVRQQRLFDDREKLISQIQALPGFENFLTSPSFDTLHSAALHGPVIMISHCEWRSDILILLRDSPPSLIHTNDDFYRLGNKLRDQLIDARRKGLESRDYEDALNSVLKKLYELVGRPVIKRLNELHIPEQSRVWWCPTSAFCSLPLHAMGPIPSEDGSKRYFMDLYIPSYIPSLSALIESRKPNSQTLDKPSILLVVQPDEYMPQAVKEMKIVRAVNTQVTTLFSKMATPTAVLSRLRDHRFAHIVCHGTLEVGKPFDASFKLYADERLSLLDIVRSQLPNAEFAFLSACHTAELTEESIADEGLHLTAAMQYCGFRSVVGTMWAMADVDGRDLARDFYKLVFADQRPGARDYERTAEALRGAVQRLRRKGGIASERWVNFVHYGA